VDTLIARKRRDDPEVRDFILTHTLTRSGDEMTLTVGTAPMPPKRPANTA
jgi:hypothetical protein